MAQIQISSEDVMAYSKQVDAYANEIRTVFNEIESSNDVVFRYVSTLFYVLTSNRKSISGKRTIFDAL